LDLVFELEFLDSTPEVHEIAMGLSQRAGQWNFETWLDEQFAEAPIPVGLSVAEGALGLEVTDNGVRPYFRDAGDTVVHPFATSWDVSPIGGVQNFSVDNDFEADTTQGGGGAVVASVNLERVTLPEPSVALLRLACLGAVAALTRMGTAPKA
jgi:hypothetical protein